MKKIIPFLNVVLGLFMSQTFVACGGDGEEEDYSNSSYYLSYKGEENTPYLDWENSMKTSWLRLEFDEGIPKDSGWNLYCGESWVKLRNTYGKVNSRSENIPVTIEDNTNYEDRDAYIYLDVDNGYPISSDYTTVTIHQYGYEYYFDCGQALSFDTDRSLADNKTLKLNISSINNVVEVDWGDNSKEVYNEKESYNTLTHQYASTAQTYRVKLRFGAKFKDGLATCSFFFNTDKNQGVTKFYDRQGNSLTTFSNSSTKKYVSYKDGEYSFNN